MIKRSNIKEAHQMSNVTYLLQPKCTETPKKIRLKHFYTVINIYTENKANIETAYMIAQALGKICKSKSLNVVDDERVHVSCRLNQYGPNYNKKIQDEFGDKIVDTVINLMRVVDIDSYKLVISRCVEGTKEIKDELSLTIKHE